MKTQKNKTEEVLNLLKTYNKTLSLLDQYDKGKLKLLKGKKGKFKLTIEEARDIINIMKKNFVLKKGAEGLFGKELEHKFESLIKNLYQTFGGKELYKSVSEKAANLLYLILKDHPFGDGNKRIAAFLFVYFLYKNKQKKTDNNTLVALVLLVAVSNPSDKDNMIKIITNLMG